MHRTINAYKLLVVDEIGYLPMSREQANLFPRSWHKRKAGTACCSRKNPEALDRAARGRFLETLRLAQRLMLFCALAQSGESLSLAQDLR
jgi:DNA replication protein DnaC